MYLLYIFYINCSKKKGKKEDNNNASGDEDENTMETQEVCINIKYCTVIFI